MWGAYRISVWCVGVTQQTAHGGVQRFGQSFDIHQADIAFTAFDRSDVGPVQVGLFCEGLLR